MRALLTAAAIAALGAAIAGFVLVTGAAGAPSHGPALMRPPARLDPIVASFNTLSASRSNRCSLQAEELMSMPDDMWLQGACCEAMDLTNYRRQVAGLSRYAAIPEIPQDPYSIPVALAKRLVSLADTVHLTPPQQAVYDTAVRQSREHGPCCCHCWRWTAFEGQAKYLITRGWNAAQTAAVWDLEDGCGGQS